MSQRMGVMTVMERVPLQASASAVPSAWNGPHPTLCLPLLPLQTAITCRYITRVDCHLPGQLPALQGQSP